MATPTEVRARLAQNDYVPIPVNGKAAVLDGWQKRTETSQGDLDIWAQLYPYAKNTGMVCTNCPTLDIDILDEVAVDAAVTLVSARFGDRGKIMMRYGLRPKVAIPFRCDVPFDKIKVLLTAPDGTAGEKIEFLCRGQQVVVHGIHPDTHAPYQWLDGSPGNTKRDELPLIDEVEAQTLVTDLVALMLLSHGYQVGNEGKCKRNGNGADDDDSLRVMGNSATHGEWLALMKTIKGWARSTFNAKLGEFKKRHPELTGGRWQSDPYSLSTQPAATMMELVASLSLSLNQSDLAPVRKSDRLGEVRSSPSEIQSSPSPSDELARLKQQLIG
jgi:hypothetical protein